MVIHRIGDCEIERSSKKKYAPKQNAPKNNSEGSEESWREKKRQIECGRN